METIELDKPTSCPVVIKLQERIKDLERVNESHRQLNGELHQRLSEVKHKLELIT